MRRIVEYFRKPDSGKMSPASTFKELIADVAKNGGGNYIASVPL